MTFDVNSPSEISSIFDNISYNKGAAILRMIQHFMGANYFQQAIREYLRTKYKNKYQYFLLVAKNKYFLFF